MIETIKMSKMKKILYILTLVGICSFSSCSDALDTNPTDKVSGSLIFGNADAAQVAMNGVYLLMVGLAIGVMKILVLWQ